jgi:hypothetical protein
MLVWQEHRIWFSRVSEALRAERARRGVRRISRLDGIETILTLIRCQFSHVRLFHACRTEDVNQYYERGIIRHSDHTLARARRLIGSVAGMDSALVERAIIQTDRELDRDRVFLALDDRQFVRFAGQYLIYGSESILAIAATIVRLGGPNARPALKTIGIPTLFTCNVALELISEAGQRAIAESLYDAYRSAGGRPPKFASPVDHTVILRADVPPGAIKSHEHPRNVVDWHEGGATYSWRC